jgi:hypothetical protein
MLNASQGALEGDALWYRSTAVRFKNDLDVKEIVNLWAGGSAAVKSMLAGTEMNARKLATICALLAALSNLIGCESSRSPDPQFQKQVMRAQECRQLQDKLVGDQPLTPERGEEIAETLNRTGCTARLPVR